MTTAGIIVIGNEVLSGKVEEENARYLIHELRGLGISLERVVVIRDDVDIIAEEVRRMAAAHTWLFTTGGVGSTHDDVTLKAVARAFDTELEDNPEILKLLEAHYGDRMNAAVRRMGQLPRGTQLLGLGELFFPVIRVKNVHVFPGVPSFVRMKFEFLKESLRHAQPFVLHQIFLNVGEDRIAEPLAEEDARFLDVEFGSYPHFDRDDFRTKVTVEGRDPARVEAARDAFLARLEPGWVVRVQAHDLTGSRGA